MITEYETEEQQVEALKEWWRRNGVGLIAGLVIGLVALFGWRFWQASIVADSEHASELFFDLRRGVQNDDIEQSGQAAIEIAGQHSSSAYDMAAALMQARSLVALGDSEAAFTRLSSINEKELDPVSRALLDLRKARLLIDLNRAGQALTLLSGDMPEAFVGIVEEVRGDALMQQGKPAQAQVAYDLARQQTIQLSDQKVLDMKYVNALAPFSGEE